MITIIGYFYASWLFLDLGVCSWWTLKVEVQTLKVEFSPEVYF
jgi:hypothetical protein